MIADVKYVWNIRNERKGDFADADVLLITKMKRGEEILEQETSSLANPLIKQENRILEEEALKKLFPRLRDVIILYYFPKLSEIAKALTLGLPLVKYRLRSAKKKLEQLMGSASLRT